jgi:hypothetical protein
MKTQFTCAPVDRKKVTVEKYLENIFGDILVRQGYNGSIWIGYHPGWQPSTEV